MGIRYAVLIVNGNPARELIFDAVGAKSARLSGQEAAIPGGKVDQNEAFWFSRGEWGVLVLGYAVGNTAAADNWGADASRVAMALPTSTAVRYFCREDTAGEVYAQSFEDGVLHFGYCEVEGAVVQDRQVGPLPAEDARYGGTDLDALVESLFPPELALATVADQMFERFSIEWPVASRHS